MNVRLLNYIVHGKIEEKQSLKLKNDRSFFNSSDEIVYIIKDKYGRVHGLKIHKDCINKKNNNTIKDFEHLIGKKVVIYNIYWDYHSGEGCRELIEGIIDRIEYINKNNKYNSIYEVYGIDIK